MVTYNSQTTSNMTFNDLKYGIMIYIDPNPVNYCSRQGLNSDTMIVGAVNKAELVQSNCTKMFNKIFNI